MGKEDRTALGPVGLRLAAAKDFEKASSHLPYIHWVYVIPDVVLRPNEVIAVATAADVVQEKMSGGYTSVDRVIGPEEKIRTDAFNNEELIRVRYGEGKSFFDYFWFVAVKGEDKQTRLVHVGTTSHVNKQDPSMSMGEFMAEREWIKDITGKWPEKDLRPLPAAGDFSFEDGRDFLYVVASEHDEFAAKDMVRELFTSNDGGGVSSLGNGRTKPGKVTTVDVFRR